MIDAEPSENYIDISTLTSTSEIPFKSLMRNKNESIPEKASQAFEFKEIKVNDSSSSIYFTQNGNKLLICVYGPRECKWKDKVKPDDAVIETYIKFNSEVNKEFNKKIKSSIENFGESLIFTELYPRCVINICINVLSYVENEYILTSALMNGVMLALSISGVDLRAFALTCAYVNEKSSVIVSLDANKPDNILLIDSSMPLKFIEYQKHIENTQNNVIELYQIFKSVLFNTVSQ